MSWQRSALTAPLCVPSWVRCAGDVPSKLVHAASLPPALPVAESAEACLPYL